jgi:hypothetical protein
MKKAYLWVVVWPFADRLQVSGDLCFSTREKFFELQPWSKQDEIQLVEIEVPEEFDHWDFIPDNY